MKSANVLKEKMLRQLVNSTQADVVALQEININWSVVPVTESLQERCKSWFRQLQTTVDYNMHEKDNPKRSLRGGTAIWVLNEAASRAGERIGDPTEMGRWSSVKIFGEKGAAVRIFSVYRPTVNTSDVDSTFNQQLRYLLKTGSEASPREAWLNDLSEAIEQANNKGEKIVVGGDINTKSSSREFTKMLRECGLREVFNEKFGNTSPSTFIGGSEKIDVIWASHDIRISACGYLDTIKRVGDHRVLWIDIISASILGEDIPRPVTVDARRLTLRNPLVVKSYVNLLRKRSKFEKTYDRLREIVEEIDEGNGKMSMMLKGKYEAVVHDFTTSMGYAEDNCRKFLAGAVEFSPEISMLRSAISYWALILRKHQGYRYNKKRLERLYAEVPEEHKHFDEMLAKRDVEKILQEVKAAYYNIKDQDDALRTEFLWKLAAARAEYKGTEVAKEFVSITKAEDARKMHRMIKLTKPPKSSKSIGTVLAPDVDLPIGGNEKSTETYSDKINVEKAVVQHMVRRFTQGYDTPPLDPEFIEIFGLYGTSEEVKDLLEGRFDMNSVETEMADLLSTFVLRGDNKMMNKSISGKEFSDLWKKIKEKTTSCPLSQHFGHFKAIATHEHLSEIMAMILSIPLRTGYSPTNYKQMTACLLEKKQGDFRIEKLRIILLLDAMYSATLRILAKWVSANAERTNRLAPEQAGSRKQMDAKNQGINIRMTMDLAILYRRPLAVICNDLKSCYDRMVHAFVGIALQSYGVPKEIVEMKFGVAQDATINVRSAHGISTTTNKSDIWDDVMTRTYHSVFQGSPDGPIQWAIVSSAVLEAYKAKGYGFKVKKAIEGTELTIVAGLFVDDSTYFQSSEEDDVQEVIDLSQQSQTYLEKLIASTGGAMNPAKSFWWLMDFKWTNGEWSWSTIEDIDAEIKIRNPAGQLESLERVEANDTRKLLGSQVCPMDNGEGTVAALTTKASKWAEFAAKRKINPTFAWIGLKAGIMKGIEWPLAAASLTEKQCNRIMQPILKVGLRSSNIQWRLSRALVYGPECYNGLGLPNAYVRMGTAMLKHVLTCFHQDNQSSSITQSLLQAMQLKFGTQELFLNTEYKIFQKAADHSWFTVLWEFMSKYGLKMEYKSHDIRRRQGDQTLTKVFTDMGYRGVPMNHLTQCKMYLQVTTMADVIDVNGTKLDPTSMTKERRVDIPHRFSWPNQQCPSDRAWQTWRSALRKLCVRSESTDIRKPLGDWTDDTRDQWTWFFSPSDTRIYKRSADDNWQGFCHTGRQDRPMGGYYTLVFHETTLPHDLHRASVAPRPHGRIRLTGWAADGDEEDDIPETNAVQSTNDDLEEAIRTFSITERTMVAIRVMERGTITGIARALRRKKLRVVSDGSYRKSTGRAGFQVRLESTDRAHHLVITQSVPGDLEVNDPYRAEAAGIWAGLICIRAIELTFDIKSGKARVGCDGKSALERCFKRNWVTLSSEPHYDLLLAVGRRLETIDSTLSPRHVEGHSDDHAEYKDLDRWQQLNVQCDSGAKLISATDYSPFHIMIPGVMFARMRGKRLVRDIQETIEDGILGPPARAYWSRKLDIDDDDLDNVNWAAIGAARKGFPPNKAKWVTKFLSENCPTGKNLKQWGFRHEDKCPFCKSSGETAQHVLRCRHSDVQKLWQVEATKLDTELTKIKTMPSLQRALIAGIRSWSRGYVPSFVGLPQVAEEQHEIGWHAAMGGMFHTSWADAQLAHYKRLGLRSTGQVWMAKAIRLIWHVAWNIWDHRNKRIHQDKILRQYENMASIDRSIRIEFTRTPPDPCPSHHRQLFVRRDLREILSRSNYHRREWLTMVENARLISSRLAVEALHQQQQILRQWLDP